MPQGSKSKTRAIVSAHIAHAPGPVRRRTKPQNDSCPNRQQGGYEVSETHTAPKNWIPASITEGEGRNDKFKIACSIATVTFATKKDSESFILHFGAAPTKQRGEHEFFSQLFNVASWNGSGHTLKARSTPMDCGNQVFRPPLFSGALKFKQLTRNDGKIAVLVTADLGLNVNRALNHKRAELVKGDCDALFKSGGFIQRGLCGKDNLAPFDVKPDEHDNARRKHIEITIRAIWDDVKRAAECSLDAGSEEATISGKPTDFSLREVETCWDIGGVGFDAIQALADISPALNEHGGKKGWEGNARNMTLEFSKWESLAVYAKAPNRLRFEIRHRPTKGIRPYSSSTLAETIGKMDLFRQIATAKLNSVLPFLSSTLAASRAGNEWEGYAMAWGACCGNSDASKALFKILRQNGRIQGGKCVECIAGGDKLLRKARDADLIENSSGAFRPVFFK